MDLFQDDQNSKEQPSQTDNYFDQLVGEGKKFKDNEALARGKFESDEFIAKLTREMREMREELDKKSTTEELIDKLRSSGVVQNSAGTPHIETPIEPNREIVDVKKQVAEILNSERQRQIAENNVALVRSELEKSWGDNISYKLKLKAKELGVSEQFLASTAETQPKAFLKLVLDSARPSDPDIPRSSVNSNQFAKRENVKNYKYYQQLRKDNRSLYFNPQTQVEMHKAAQTLGEDFYK